MVKNKFGRPKKRNINKKEMGNYLKTIGFGVEKIDQPWRHLIAYGKFKGNDAVFKLASTQITSPKTKNEYNWNEAVHLIPDEYRKSFTVPQNYASGEYNKLFYFISQRFTTESLVKYENVSKVAERITQIAQAAREIEILPIPQNSNFYVTQNEKKQSSIGEKLLSSATYWASKANLRLDFDKLLQVVKDDKNNIRTCIGHGDFVARQMYSVDGKIGIIDGEHAGIRGAIYYDVAWFYIRLRTENNALELARQFLLEFKNLLPAYEKENFWEELKPVLIQRYIGSVWDRGKNIDAEKEKSFTREILEDKILLD